MSLQGCGTSCLEKEAQGSKLTGSYSCKYDFLGRPGETVVQAVGGRDGGSELAAVSPQLVFLE